MITGMGTCAAALLAFAAAVIFWCQLGTMQSQLVAGQRPWVYADDIRINGPITNDAQGMEITLQTILKNVGHSPAQYTSVDFRIVVWDNDLSKIATEVCKNTEIGKVNFWNAITLFPDKPTPYGIGEILKRSDIRKIQYYFRDEKRVPITEPMIVGCVVYRLTADGEYHWTPFIRMLEMANPKDASGCCTIPFDKPSIPEGAAILREVPLDQIGPAT